MPDGDALAPAHRCGLSVPGIVRFESGSEVGSASARIERNEKKKTNVQCERGGASARLEQGMIDVVDEAEGRYGRSRRTIR